MCQESSTSIYEETNGISVYIIFSSFAPVLNAYCACPAEIDGQCNHVSATLFALEEYCKEMDKNDQELCTSKSCKWNVPRKRKETVTTISQMTIQKHDYSKRQKKEWKSLILTDQDERPVHQREWAPENVNTMLTKIKERR